MDLITLLIITTYGSFGISKVLEFINEARVKIGYKKLSKETNLEYSEIIKLLNEHGCPEERFNLKSELLPIYNILAEISRLKSTKGDYEINKEILRYYHPEIFGEELVFPEREYFVGYFDNSKPVNIFFQTDGVEISILDYSASSFLALSDEEQIKTLLYLLYCCYQDEKSVNHSYNISELFRSNLVVEQIKNYVEKGTTCYDVITEENMGNALRTRQK